MSEEVEALRANFLKLFAAIPSPLRNEIVAFIDDEPYTWAAAYLDISNNTAKGDKILKFLKHAKIIE
ncbi:MAG: hypothetical protein ABH863_05015 [Candidatus Micrarchaeota archaeon]